MLTNADCTLYLCRPDGSYRRLAVGNVYWEGTRGTALNKTGSAAVDSVLVHLPIDADLPEKTSGKDYLLKGLCTFEVSPESPIRDLVKQGDAYTITSIAKWDGGSAYLQYWEVRAK
ncbi:hypothetical protein KQI11_05670 [Acetanaerobacterium sp. MSJ-12]|uniref:hypothetical protein n=1 Tax=Acetanaerobacterium sp. MSJ-12 TaxID=2841535 RepID=UPI001C0EB07A|nr:hypothetical protein [Acetanaerobacterium sp. MSJ-12]MBU5419608.1 hypothetical protein [Acetanaerobacterium sp. MSJ-12]